MERQLDEATFVRRVLIVLLIVAAAAVLWLLSPLVLLVFGAVLVAITLRTLATPLMRLNIPDWISVSVAIIAVACALGALVVFFGAELAQQAATLNERFTSGLKQWAQTFDLPQMQEVLNGANLTAVIPRFVSWSVSLGQAVLGAALVIVGGIYIALNPTPYRDGLLKLVPKPYQANATATVDDISEALHLWLGGLLMAMVLIGALTAFGLWIAGVQSPVLLGVLAGVANFVPYIGSIAAAAVTLIIAAAQGWETIAWAAAVMFIVQQIESNIITPLVVGRAVYILPATGLFAIVAMAIMFGPLGVLFGFPLAIVTDIVVRRLYVRDTLDKPVEILGDPAARSETVEADAR